MSLQEHRNEEKVDQWTRSNVGELERLPKFKDFPNHERSWPHDELRGEYVHERIKRKRALQTNNASNKKIQDIYRHSVITSFLNLWICATILSILGERKKI